ncbi:MAG: hypothetical protein NVSMB1_24500 [Polyangiales bacterium]
MKHLILTTLSLSALVLASCSKKPIEPDPVQHEPAVPTAATSSVTPKTAAAPPPSPTEAPVTNLAWDTPAKWKTMPNPNAMRKATYRVPKADGDHDDADMSVSQAGGSVDANIQRWVSQFDGVKEPAKKTERTVAGFKVTIAEVQGSFNGGGMPGAPSAPKASYAMLAAIVETPGGTQWFFKLVGPAKSVAAARTDFDKLVSSIHVS